MKVLLFCLFASPALAALTCTAISNLVTNTWCNQNCNHVPPNCPAGFCSCAAAGASRSPSPSRASTRSPSPTIAPSKIKYYATCVTATDGWCQSICTAAPNDINCKTCCSTSLPTQYVSTCQTATNSWCQGICSLSNTDDNCQKCCTIPGLAPHVNFLTGRFFINSTTSIDFSNQGLSGTIPTAIGRLSILSSLNIQNNKVFGTIPSEVGALTSLVNIVFNNNMLMGSLPIELANLNKLEVFYIANNRLSGSIPIGFLALGKLGFADLSWNLFTAIPGATEIPPSATNLVLNYVNIANNPLTFPGPQAVTDLYCNAVTSCLGTLTQPTACSKCTYNAQAGSESKTAPTLTFTTVASGLCSPRGLSLEADGFIYVAEAGVGGTSNCGVDDLGMTACQGNTGGVSKIWPATGAKTTVLSGLLSYGARTAGGSLILSATGPHKAFINAASGKLLVVMGADVGSEILVSDGQVSTFADVEDAETTFNPDGEEIDSNPFDAVQLSTGEIIVVDAGANALWLVDQTNGDVIPVQSFDAGSHICKKTGTVGACNTALPPGVGPFFCCGFINGSNTYPAQYVPTAIAVRPNYNSQVFVANLMGALWTSNEAKIVKFDLDNIGNGAVDVVSGFNSIISIAFDGPNDLYILEQNFYNLGTFFGSSQLSKYDLTKQFVTRFNTNLNGASKLLVSNGWLYASDKAHPEVVAACQGQVVKVNLRP